MIKVNLVTYTDEPEFTVARAARLCYAAVGIDDLTQKMSDNDCCKLLDKIIKAGHFSALEHANFTFAIEGVSRALSHQLVRHRLASYSQQSQRYVRADNMVAVVPPSVSDNPEAIVIFNQAIAAATEAYQQLLALGIHREDARYLLPNAADTKIVVTMNARELRHFFSLRCCERAQWEIRKLAREMLTLAKQVAPVLFAGAGAECESSGYCPEGTLSCGRAPLK